MLAALGILIKNWKLVASVAGTALFFAALAGVAAYEHHIGYTSGYDTAHQQCEDEKTKQETANQNAINKSAEILRQTEQQLELKDAQIDDYLKALDAQADAAPNAASCGLDAGSVQHLSAIQ